MDIPRQEPKDDRSTITLYKDQIFSMQLKSEFQEFSWKPSSGFHSNCTNRKVFLLRSDLEFRPAPDPLYICAARAGAPSL